MSFPKINNTVHRIMDFKAKFLNSHKLKKYMYTYLFITISELQKYA